MPFKLFFFFKILLIIRLKLKRQCNFALKYKYLVFFIIKNKIIVKESQTVMDFPKGVQFFIHYMFGPLIVLFGLFGNISGLILLFKRNLKQLGPVSIYKILLILNSIKLFQIFPLYAQSFNFNLSVTNEIVCKSLSYLEFSLSNYSPMILIYISADRYISIRYPQRKHLLKNCFIQIAYVFGVNILAFIIFSPIYIYSTIELADNSTLVCQIYNSEQSKLVNFLTNMILSILYFIVLFIFSLLMFYCILISRNQARNTLVNSELKKFSRHFSTAVLSFLMNILYLLLYFPISLSAFFDMYTDFFILTYYIYYLDYAITFYLLLSTNSTFRRKYNSLVNEFLNKFRYRLY